MYSNSISAFVFYIFDFAEKKEVEEKLSIYRKNKEVVHNMEHKREGLREQFDN